MLGKAGDELKKVTDSLNHTTELRKRFEDDFEKARSETFNIPLTEGKWETFTSNRASTDIGRLVNTLSSSRLKLWIPLTDEDKKQRKDLSKTEQFPYGVIALRDSIYQTIPEALPLHESMSWFAPNRGWMVLLCYLFEEDDGKNGAVKPHIPVLDILNTYWISGSEGLLWFCTKRYASPEDVKDQYEEDLKPDSKGRIVLHNVWDKDQYGTIGEGDWVGSPTDHHAGHIPALILPGGSTPHIQSERHDDTMKDVGESALEHNRNLYEIESRMGSYALTIAGRTAKTPLKFMWDSTKGGQAPELESSPFEKGSTIPLDIGMGQDLVSGVSPEMTRDFYAYWEYLQARLREGSKTPADFANISSAGPAAGLNILRHASLTNIKPFQKLMERSYVWLAQELVSQYKSGGFGKMEIQGLDGLNRRFKMEVKPGDIDDGWQFEAQLKADFPQDEMANIGMAVQATQAELLSIETALDKYDLVDDTDLEQRKKDREKAYGVAGIAMRRVAKALKEDEKDDEGAQFILDELEGMKEQSRTRGVASQPGISSPVSPSADTTAALPEPPQASKLRNFLSRLGGR